MNNRELKFRAFYENKLYVQEYCGGFSYFIHNESTALSLESVFIAAESGKCIIQQYTGLKDCNGKEIYEGDIVEYTYNVGCFRLSNGELIRGGIPSNETVQEKINQEVKWQGAQFIGIHPIRKIGYYLVDKKPQVIGNIFETPELLKNE
jgi:uncharacterized phage protein (TIGR01671 family)